jgi:hypothetical protein
MKFATETLARKYLAINGYTFNACFGLWYRDGEKYGVQFGRTMQGYSIVNECEL